MEKFEGTVEHLLKLLFFISKKEHEHRINFIYLFEININKLELNKM